MIKNANEAITTMLNHTFSEVQRNTIEMNSSAIQKLRKSTTISEDIISNAGLPDDKQRWLAAVNPSPGL